MKQNTTQRRSVDHDAYLRAAAAAKTPVSVCFLDGEEIPAATIKQVWIFTILLNVAGAGDVLVYKNSLKKISAVVPEVDRSEEPGDVR